MRPMLRFNVSEVALRCVLVLVGIVLTSTGVVPIDGFFAPRMRHRVSSLPNVHLQSTLSDIADSLETDSEEVDVLELQKQAEKTARARHDLSAMNALFVDVKEHPNPTNCVVSKGPIPTDLPSGALLRIGPNGACKL